MEEKSLASEILGELKSQNERTLSLNKILSRILIIVIILWFATTGMFVWYINQYDYVDTVTTSQVEMTNGDSGNIDVSGSVTNGNN